MTTMPSFFLGIIVLSASMAVVPTAQAKKHPQRLPVVGHVQTPMGHQQPTSDDLEVIQKENELNDLPASHDAVTGAVPLESQDDALTRKIEQDNVRLDRLINGICPTCGQP